VLPLSNARLGASSLSVTRGRWDMESAYVPPTAGGAWVAWYRSHQRRIFSGMSLRTRRTKLERPLRRVGWSHGVAGRGGP